MANYGECDDFLSSEDDFSGNHTPSSSRVDASDCETTTRASSGKSAETTKVSVVSTILLA